jgi:hypothetical protein
LFGQFDPLLQLLGSLGRSSGLTRRLRLSRDGSFPRRLGLSRGLPEFWIGRSRHGRACRRRGAGLLRGRLGFKFRPGLLQRLSRLGIKRMSCQIANRQVDLFAHRVKATSREQQRYKERPAFCEDS